MGQPKCRARWNVNGDKALAETIRHARIPLCITDPNLPDNPIIFANTAFLELTGYSEHEVIGRNCRLLQGECTAADSIESVRNAVRNCKVETVEIVNYRKDGSSFVNALQIGPIFDDNGNLMFYFGSQLDVTEKRDAERRARELAEVELLHRLGNIVNVMDVVIRNTAREEQDTAVFANTVSERLKTLSKAHFQTIGKPDDRSPGLPELAETILSAYSPGGGEQYSMDGPDLVLPRHLLSCVALTLHELATNSVKHGALGIAVASVEIRWSVDASGADEKLTLYWREVNGPKVAVPERNSGSKIVCDLIVAVGGTIEFDWKESGLEVTASFPLS